MTINGSTNNANWTYKLEVTETSTSVLDRTSTVQVKTYLGRASSTSYLGGNFSNTVSVTGAAAQTQSNNIPYPTYISGGDWYELGTFTFIVPNNNNPTTVTITSTFSSGDFTPSYASASGNMQLTILHLNPEILTAQMVETNQDMIDLGIPDTTIVQHLSKKTITLRATTSDEAVPSYRLEHYNTNYVLPTPPDEYQASAVFNTDYTQNDVVVNNVGKAKIIQRIKDSMNGMNSDWLFVTISGQITEPNGIAYTKPSIERTSTSIKRKSGNGTNLTDNKAELNLKATFYKENDVIGNNNSVTQVGYKIWATNESEPVNYTSVTPTISGGDITITGYEISNVNFVKVYNYKIIVTDNYGYSAIIEDGRIPLGQSVWSEYKDRVDFLKLTVGGYNPFEYSSNETKCGIWNGKPLYRKVYTITRASSTGPTWTDFADMPTNLETVVSMYGTSSESPSGNTKPTPHWEEAGGSAYYELYIARFDTHKLAYQSAYGSGTSYVILEYTKTTD